ncbi:cupin domain-containing protein [Vitiosangium sp. GDMCC 1.1324]|uniref:cupin domain-containing protein n=1 Tax=Vitiosangium sp. (strain GDMCC 1.1324) TaxID=2138576 RepID=UPI000D39A172|nr:cupin domain-containing protein [Vitiosangium sp. GDMCC 1.1324]PTL79872.1 cupin [Vitiosangium sp. GDMCC 1.1324]
MTVVNLQAFAAGLPDAWRSRVLGQVGPARIKVLRMDSLAYEEELHDYNEALLVLEGEMALTVRGEPVHVRAGELYLVEAGTPHAVARGSHGTLVIVDV